MGSPDGLTAGAPASAWAAALSSSRFLLFLARTCRRFISASSSFSALQWRSVDDLLLALRLQWRSVDEHDAQPLRVLTTPGGNTMHTPCDIRRVVINP